LTAIIGGWLIFKTLSEQGPVVTITFSSADGIEAGKTRVRYKHVDIGVVETVTLNEDLSGVTVEASFGRESENLLLRNSRFWVVRPRLTLRGATGLGTLVSGAYIELEPGAGLPQRHFQGLESPPVVRAGMAGKNLMLLAPRLGSINVGTPLYYQGIEAGEVLSYDLGSDRRSLFIHTFIRSPYDRLIRGNSRFWRVSGVDVSMGADGFNLRTASLQSLLYGGIAFDNPQREEMVGDEDIEALIFTLHDDYSAVEEKSYTQKLRFMLFFDGSVRGLNIGAPVELKGIKVGEVVDITLEYDPEKLTFRIPVTVEIEPERVVDRSLTTEVTPYEMVDRLVQHGLRAQLQTGSLLTGQLFVGLDIYPETEIRYSGREGDLPELPTLPGSFDKMTRSVQGFLEQLERLNIVEIGDELILTLRGANQLLSGGELQDSLTSVASSLQRLHSILSKLDNGVEPLVSGVDSAVAEGRAVLAESEVTLKLLNELLKPDSPAQFNLIRMTRELSDAARAVRTLVDLLERNPESLLYGK
ncbi:MAG: MCE family protein, partial [Gammaproteobacteria bacterium]|nr:MCE family protein [Gammaproteobacteria bacterium]